MPATMAWGYGRSFVPSSSCLMTTTFFPAWRPWRTIATWHMTQYHTSLRSNPKASSLFLACTLTNVYEHFT